MSDISPDGGIRVDIDSVEWFNTHWVNTPRVFDVASGACVLDLWNTDWDATVSFPATRQVRLSLRRYRGGCCAIVELDLLRQVARIGAPQGDSLAHADPQAASIDVPLAQLPAALEAWSQRDEIMRTASSHSTPAQIPNRSPSDRPR